MTTSQSVRSLVVGAGLMGRWHAAAAVRAGARIVGVVDPDAARARALASRHGNCTIETSLAAALRHGPVDVVHLCTPTATHEELATAAIVNGCHVFIEKPVASTWSVTKRLVDLALERKRLICPCHQFLFQRGVLEACQALPSLGSLRHIDVAICSAGADTAGDDARDQIAIEILPHPFSLFARLLPTGLDGLDWHVQHSAPGELRLSAVGGGFTVGIVISMHGRPTRNRLRAIADRGTTECDLFHGFATVERGAPSRGDKIGRPFSEAMNQGLATTVNLARRLATQEVSYPGLRELIRRFYAGIATGHSPIETGETLAVAKACDEVRQALRL